MSVLDGDAPLDPVATAEAAWATVRREGQWALRHVPDELKTPELCAEGVARRPWELICMPEALRTPEMWLTGIRYAGWNLPAVPERLKTPEICLEAVRRTASASSGRARSPAKAKTESSKACFTMGHAACSP